MSVPESNGGSDFSVPFFCFKVSPCCTLWLGGVWCPPLSRGFEVVQHSYVVL